MNEQELEEAVRRVEANEWDAANRYVLRAKWSELTQKMKASRAGGLAWRVLDKERDAVLLDFANRYFEGDLRKASLDLIKDIK